MRRPKRRDAPEMLSGQRWRAAHQSTVDSILGPRVRPVRSYGDSFFNKDTWYSRAFTGAMCEWAELNSGSIPTRQDIESWVAQANRVQVLKKEIVIAAIPDKLSKGLASALTGGGYHEAWHTKYSRNTKIHIREVYRKVLDLWGLAPFDPDNGLHGWKGLTGTLLSFQNVFEDIWIERVGCQEYPGSRKRMEDLQDLILNQETQGRQVAEHRGLPTDSTLSVVVGTLRDLGLGYQTPTQLLAINRYQEVNLKAYDMVTEGPLRPLLDEVISLGPGGNNDLASLWLSMRAIGIILQTSQQPDQPEAQEGGGEGEGEEGGSPGGPSQSGGGGKQNDQKVWKKGDRAKLKVGSFAGREVEIVRATLPDEDGVQQLEFTLVEKD